MSDPTQLLALPENNFISSYAVAEQIVSQAVESHDTYWKLIKDCQDHIDGKKPNDPDVLKKKGMSWASNFNFGKARAKIEKGTAEAVASVSSAIALGYPTFRNASEGDPELLSFLKDRNQRGLVASAIGLALFQTLYAETRLASWLNKIEYPAYAYGWTALLFDPFDWMPAAIHPLKIAFKPKTEPDNITTWVTFDVIEADELYRKWVKAYNERNKRKKTASAGWDLDGLQTVLLNAYSGEINGKTPESWDMVIPSYISEPSACITNTKSVSIAKIHYREMDGSLTVVYIPWQNVWQKAGDKKENKNVPSQKENKIIFKKNYSKYDRKKWIGLIRDSGFTSADGYIQDLRGLAKYAVEDSVGYNRLRNGINNKMQFIGSPFFEQGNSQIEKFKVSVSQGFVILPAGHSLVPQQPTFDISQHINVLRFTEGEYLRDTQQFDPTIQGRLTSRPNKGEVQAVSSEVQFLSQAKNTIKFKDYSHCFHTVITRLPELSMEAKDPGKEGRDRFYMRAKANLEGIVKIESDEDINKIISCMESYSIETVINDIDAITVALQLAETPFGRNRLKRMLMLAKGFPIEEVNASIPLVMDKYSDLGDARVAAIENDMMWTTNEIILSAGDDHVTHLESHLAKCERVVEGVKSKALSPVDALKFLTICLTHAQEHNNLFMAVPVFLEKAKEYQAKISQLNQVTNQIRIVAEQVMQAQQREASKVQMDPEKEARIAIANAEAQSAMERKNWVAEQRTQQRETQIQLDHELRTKELELKAQHGQ